VLAAAKISHLIACAARKSRQQKPGADDGRSQRGGRAAATDVLVHGVALVHGALIHRRGLSTTGCVVRGYALVAGGVARRGGEGCHPLAGAFELSLLKCRGGRTGDGCRTSDQKCREARDDPFHRPVQLQRWITRSLEPLTDSQP
jgi:hypothetical protein